MDWIMASAAHLHIADVVALVFQRLPQTPVRLDEGRPAGSLPGFLRPDLDIETQVCLRRALDLLGQPFGIRCPTFVTAPERAALRQDVAKNLGVLPGHVGRT